MRKLFLSLLLCATAIGAYPRTSPDTTDDAYTPSPEVKQAQQEFRDSRFGIFIHWGIYSMLADGEWVMHNKNLNYQEYAHLADGFYPSKFNAEEWVKAFKDAGAKYVTFTSRHHDGFSMFHTQASPYNIVDATPFHRDVAKELADACQKEGLKLHFYYSHIDWGRPDFPTGGTGKGTGRPTNQQDYDHYFQFMQQQLTELLTNYGPVGAIWFDGLWDKPKDFNWRLSEQYELIHRLQPSCLVANNHHRVPYAGEDIQIFEQDLPGQNTAGYSGESGISQLPLETCLTMNGTWGYRITDKNYKSADRLIQALVGAAGRDANLLLNIGPRPDGQLPTEALERLKAMGQWMKANGETIYGTRGGFIAPHDWGVTTQKGSRLFVHIFKLQDTTLFLPTGSHKVKGAKLFATGEKLKLTKTPGGVTITLPALPKGPDTIVELSL